MPGRGCSCLRIETFINENSCLLNLELMDCYSTKILWNGFNDKNKTNLILEIVQLNDNLMNMLNMTNIITRDESIKN